MANFSISCVCDHYEPDVSEDAERNSMNEYYSTADLPRKYHRISSAPELLFQDSSAAGLPAIEVFTEDEDAYDSLRAMEEKSLQPSGRRTPMVSPVPLAPGSSWSPRSSPTVDFASPVPAKHGLAPISATPLRPRYAHVQHAQLRCLSSRLWREMPLSAFFD